MKLLGLILSSMLSVFISSHATVDYSHCLKQGDCDNCCVGTCSGSECNAQECQSKC